MTTNVLAARGDARLSNRLLREHAYIGGVWIGGSERLDIINPATGETVGDVPKLGAAEAEMAVATAHSALERWAERSARERSDLLGRWHALIVEAQEDLAALLTAEQGKPLAEARAEIASTAAYVKWFAEEAVRAYGDTIPGHMPGKRLAVLRMPVGVVAAITPWNFPSSMVARKVAPALAAGCTIVVKPSEVTPFSALALAALAEKAGIPAGTLNVVTGDAAAIGSVLTDDPRVRKLTFTGSTAVGKMLAARAAATVKRVTLELGGNAPFLVFDDADVGAAIEGAIASKFRNSGQTCVCANRFIVQSGVYDSFATGLAAAADALVMGNGMEAGVTQGPLIDDRALTKVRRHVADALERGGRFANQAPRGASRPPWYPATVIRDLDPGSLLCREETFGPVAGLLRFDDEAEALRLANDSAAGLAAYVYTRDLGRSWRVAEALQYGMVGINTGMVTTEVAPFGGMKESGYGREGSRHGLSDYLELKTVCVDIGKAA